MVLAVLLEAMEAIAVLAICRYLLQLVAVAVVAEMVRHCLAELAVAVAVRVDFLGKLPDQERAVKDQAEALLETKAVHTEVVVVVVQPLPDQMVDLLLVRAEQDTHSATEIRLLVAEAAEQALVVQLHLVGPVEEVMEEVPLEQLAAMAEHIRLEVKPLGLAEEVGARVALVAERALQLVAPEQLAL